MTVPSVFDKQAPQAQSGSDMIAVHHRHDDVFRGSGSVSDGTLK